MFCKPQEFNTDEIVSRWFKKYLNASGLESQMIETSYGQMHYYDSAPSSHLKPLVFIHGLGSSAQSWWILAKMLLNKRRVVLVDLFHMSGFSIPNKSSMDFLDHSKSLVEFLKILTNKHVDMCGLSLGGWLSLHIAAMEKDLVDNLILMNPAGVMKDPIELRDRFLLLKWENFNSFYNSIFHVFSYTKIPFLNTLMKKILFKSLQNKGVKDLLKSMKMEYFMDPYLDKITCPVLLLWGHEDKLLSPEEAEFLACQIKNVKAEWVEGCAHVLALEAPVNCYNQICAFLNLNPKSDNIFTTLILKTGKMYPMQPIVREE